MWVTKDILVEIMNTAQDNMAATEVSPLNSPLYTNLNTSTNTNSDINSKRQRTSLEHMPQCHKKNNDQLKQEIKRLYSLAEA